MISRRVLFQQHTRFIGVPANLSITVLSSDTDQMSPTAMRGIDPVNDGRRWLVGDTSGMSRASDRAFGHTRRDVAER